MPHNRKLPESHLETRQLLGLHFTNTQLADWSIILQIWDNLYVISLKVLTKKKQNTRRVYQISRAQTPLIPRPRKVTGNLYLTCKNI